MKILHTEASCGWGGQEIRILEESRGMIGRGHAVAVACPPHARMAEEAPRYGVPVIHLPIEFKTLTGFFALQRHLACGDYDVVNTHSSADSWLVALACATLSRPPVIIRTRHISAPVANNFANRWLYGRACQRIVTTGDKLCRELVRDLALANNCVTSIPTGINLSRFFPSEKVAARRRLGLPEAGVIIGIVATLRSWKGHRYLLDAFASLSDKTCHLLIVGDGPGRKNLQEQAQSLGISARLLMPGNQNDVVPWLTAMDIFTLPSYANEGVPQSIMQAMACGLPVISTPVGSIPEILTHELTGLLVPPRDSQALTEALSRLMFDHPLREKVSDAAQVKAHRDFGEKLMIDRMETVFYQASLTR